MLDAVGAIAADGEMFALVYFPTLRNHAVVDLRELLTAGTEGDHVFLDLGGGQRILIEVVDVGAKEDMRQLKNNHLNSRGWVGYFLCFFSYCFSLSSLLEPFNF